MVHKSLGARLDGEMSTRVKCGPPLERVLSSFKVRVERLASDSEFELAVDDCMDDNSSSLVNFSDFADFVLRDTEVLGEVLGEVLCFLDLPGDLDLAGDLCFLDLADDLCFLDLAGDLAGDLCPCFDGRV